MTAEMWEVMIVVVLALLTLMVVLIASLWDHAKVCRSRGENR